MSTVSWQMTSLPAMLRARRLESHYPPSSSGSYFRHSLWIQMPWRLLPISIWTDLLQAPVWRPLVSSSRVSSFARHLRELRCPELRKAVGLSSSYWTESCLKEEAAMLMDRQSVEPMRRRIVRELLVVLVSSEDWPHPPPRQPGNRSGHTCVLVLPCRADEVPLLP